MSQRLVSKVQQDDSNSGISSAASVGNSSSSVAPSLLLESYGNTHGQIVSLRNQTNLAFPSPNVFTRQHVDLSSQLVASQTVELLHNWNFSPRQCHLTDTGTNLLTLPSSKSAYPYPFINEASCRPPHLFAQYFSTSFPPITTTPSHLTVSSALQQTRPSLAHTEFLPHSTLLSHLSKPNLFNEFLNSWAQNIDNPSLPRPPPPFHLVPPLSQAHTHTVKPISNKIIQPSYPKSTHKITTHAHSRFRPYPITRSSTTQPLPHHQAPISLSQPTLSLGHTTSQELPATFSRSPSPPQPIPISQVPPL